MDSTTTNPTNNKKSRDAERRRRRRKQKKNKPVSTENVNGVNENGTGGDDSAKENNDPQMVYLLILAF